MPWECLDVAGCGNLAESAAVQWWHRPSEDQSVLSFHKPVSCFRISSDYMNNARATFGATRYQPLLGHPPLFVEIPGLKHFLMEWMGVHTGWINLHNGPVTPARKEQVIEAC